MRESRIFSNALLLLIPRCGLCDIIAFSARAKARDKLMIQWKRLRGIRAGIWSIPQEPLEVLSVNFRAKLGVVVHTHTHTHTHTLFCPRTKHLYGDQIKDDELRGERHLANMGRREIYTEFW